MPCRDETERKLGTSEAEARIAADPLAAATPDPVRSRGPTRLRGLQSDDVASTTKHWQQDIHIRLIYHSGSLHPKIIMDFASKLEQLQQGQTAEFPDDAKTLEYARLLDSQDELAHMRDQFIIPTRASLRKTALNRTCPGKLMRAFNSLQFSI